MLLCASLCVSLCVIVVCAFEFAFDCVVMHDVIVLLLLLFAMCCCVARCVIRWCGCCVRCCVVVAAWRDVMRAHIQCFGVSLFDMIA